MNHESRFRVALAIARMALSPRSRSLICIRTTHTNNAVRVDVRNRLHQDDLPSLVANLSPERILGMPPEVARMLRGVYAHTIERVVRMDGDGKILEEEDHTERRKAELTNAFRSLSKPTDLN